LHGIQGYLQLQHSTAVPFVREFSPSSQHPKDSRSDAQ
jgi:hypothetical protein